MEGREGGRERGKGGEKRQKEKKRNKRMLAPHQQRHHRVSKDKRKPSITNWVSDHLRKMHQPQASCILHQTWTGNLFLLW